MGYYKVMKDDKVIDLLSNVIYLKYQPKHDIMILCDESEAQAILSSDGEDIWHEKTLRRVPVDKYETVELIEIDKYDYRQLKGLNGKTPDEIIDGFVMSLIDGGVL